MNHEQEFQAAPATGPAGGRDLTRAAKVRQPNRCLERHRVASPVGDRSVAPGPTAMPGARHRSQPAQALSHDALLSELGHRPWARAERDGLRGSKPRGQHCVQHQRPGARGAELPHPHFHFAPFTWLVRNNSSVTEGLGISLQEIYFLECLGQVQPSRSIFIVGNSFGWSSLALAYPRSRVVAIDAGYEEYSLQGLDLTNRLAAQLQLDVVAIQATSPQDVSSIVSKHLDNQIDLALIDGLHTTEQIIIDWRAIQPFMRTDGLILFHDVIIHSLQSGFETILAESGWQGTLLHATSSGMGILAHSPSPSLARLIHAFAVDPEARTVVEAEAASPRWRRTTPNLQSNPCGDTQTS
jgi:predicted O-methyltransferase YrrM